MGIDRVSRRTFIRLAGGATAATVLGSGRWPAAAAAALAGTGYAADGVNGEAEAFPIGAVRLLDSPFKANQARNTAYLKFVDKDRLLRSWQINYGLPTAAAPVGGWEAPTSEIRGHCLGHLLSGLAFTVANTGDPDLLLKGRQIVSALATCQANAAAAGFHAGYLSAFPESVFDRLEAGTPVWAPWYVLHKVLAGLLDQHQLAGNAQALDVATRMGDWIDWRTGRLTEAQMQQTLEAEFGGMMESLANLSRITGSTRYLDVARRFDHHAVFNPLDRNIDQLAGLHANTQIPKIVGAARLWEETADLRYRHVSFNFWFMVASHRSYVIGGNSNYEYFGPPDVLAASLSNQTCENCNSYNMLKLTRLLHHQEAWRVDLMDYYERVLFNQMLGEQDPDSAHGFNIYYTGLGPGAFKRQPAFMGADPNVYSTDYDNFSCDHGSGMETQAKFADTIYMRDATGLYVNLFIASEVTWAERAIALRQTTTFPDSPTTRIEVLDGDATLGLRIRVPGWARGVPTVRLNGAPYATNANPGTWLDVNRRWVKGDAIEVTFAMDVAIEATPDNPGVGAVTYGPVALAGTYGAREFAAMPRIVPGSVRRTGPGLTFAAAADDETIAMLPIARVHHQHYNTYWLTSPPPPPPPATAAWYKLDDGAGTKLKDSSGNANDARVDGIYGWVVGRGGVGAALWLNGTSGHVVLPEAVMRGARAFSVATWVKLDEVRTWSRLLDVGLGRDVYLFLTPRSDANTLRYGISVAGPGNEQRIDAPPLTAGVWTHVAVTYDGTSVGTLYVNGQAVGQNTAMTLMPLRFGDHITQLYVGRSLYDDPYLKGFLDDYRIYGRALSASEVAGLAAG
jgi:uncharacterized protein